MVLMVPLVWLKPRNTNPTTTLTTEQGKNKLNNKRISAQYKFVRTLSIEIERYKAQFLDSLASSTSKILIRQKVRNREKKKDQNTHLKLI